MFKQALHHHSGKFAKLLNGSISLTFLILLIEFFDELHYGIGNAALPSLRHDLELSYAQVGLLLGLPGIINAFVEPILMLLGDTRLRKPLVIGGGLAIVLATATFAVTYSFPLILLASIIAFPASGAFVTLAQATLMDLNPGREAQMMARWTAAGSLANLAGPLLMAGSFAVGLGWRWSYAALALFCLGLVIVVIPRPFPTHVAAVRDSRHSGGKGTPEALPHDLFALLNGLREAIHNRHMMRWMVLLQLSDLLLDILTGYLALYFTDIAGLSLAQTSLLLSVLMLAGLLSNLLLIPLLEHIPGRRVVRLSAGVVAVLYAAWLLAPWLWAKVALIIIIKLATLGWYEVLQGEAYATMPGRSGTVMAIGSAFGLAGGSLSWLVGWIAAQAGLPVAMWLLLIGPISLALFVPSIRHPKCEDSHAIEQTDNS